MADLRPIFVNDMAPISKLSVLCSECTAQPVCLCDDHLAPSDMVEVFFRFCWPKRNDQVF